MDAAAPGLSYYPLNDFGPVMKGLVIGGLDILHVFLAQFAIGGGILMTYFERLSGRGEGAGRAPLPRRVLQGARAGELRRRRADRRGDVVHQHPGQPQFFLFLAVNGALAAWAIRTVLRKAGAVKAPG